MNVIRYQCEWWVFVWFFVVVSPPVGLRFPFSRPSPSSTPLARSAFCKHEITDRVFDRSLHAFRTPVGIWHGFYVNVWFSSFNSARFDVRVTESDYTAERSVSIELIHGWVAIVVEKSFWAGKRHEKGRREKKSSRREKRSIKKYLLTIRQLSIIMPYSFVSIIIRWFYRRFGKLT